MDRPVAGSDGMHDLALGWHASDRMIVGYIVS